MGTNPPPSGLRPPKNQAEFTFDFEYFDSQRNITWWAQIEGSGQARLGVVFRKGQLVIAGGDFIGRLKMGSLLLESPKTWAMFLAVLDSQTGGWVQASLIEGSSDLVHHCFFSNSEEAGFLGSHEDRDFKFSIVPNSAEKAAGFRPEISDNALVVHTHVGKGKEVGFGRWASLLGGIGTIYMAVPGGTTADPGGPPPLPLKMNNRWRIVLRSFGVGKPNF